MLVERTDAGLSIDSLPALDRRYFSFQVFQKNFENYADPPIHRICRHPPSLYGATSKCLYLDLAHERSQSW
jgi:hypothetical protein